MRFGLYIRNEDEPFLGNLKLLLNPHQVSVYKEQSFTTVERAMMQDDNILVSSPTFLKKMLGLTKLSLDDYQGSFWQKQSLTKKPVKILAIPPPKQMYSTKPGTFLMKRFLAKILKPELLYQPTPFEWEKCDDLLGYNTAFEYISHSDIVAVDIETSPAYTDWQAKTGARHIILSVSYSAVRFLADGNNVSIRTFVIPIRSLESVRWMRKINALEVAKIFQNGKYDNFYFLRYGAPCRNWFFDTLDAHHCYYSELPKNLGYIAAFYLREVSFWKDEAESPDPLVRLQYNGKDTWGTANVFLTQLKEAPSWVWKNYVIKFGLNFPCLATGIDGLLIHKERHAKAWEKQKNEQEKALSALQKIVGSNVFNPSSPQQVLRLLQILGCKDLKSSDKKSLELAADRHPINRRIIDGIKDFRKAKKLDTTYFGAELRHGKLLYTLDPSGTDTGRLASSESALWGGAQIQNIPPYFKTTIVADDGYYLGEGDNKQSETYCTAFLSGDENLIATLASGVDFHAMNASKFLGLDVKIVLDEEKEAKKAEYRWFTRRDLAKRINHGATYYMEEVMLLIVMGLKKVLEAQKLMNLPKHFSPTDVTKHLLKVFNETYPDISKQLYPWIVAEIRSTKKLTSALGWTRYCFGNPSLEGSGKKDLKGYIAHIPSNLSVGIINEGFEEIYWKIQVPSNGAFRLKAQIHDSILFAYKIGRLDLVEHAFHLMNRPKLIKDVRGKTRTMHIPVDMKGEGVCWTELKPLEFSL